MSEAIMSAGHPDGKITRRDRQIARLWQWAPWLTFPIVTVGPPAAFWLAYLLTSTDATVFLLLDFSSISFALIAAVIMVLLLVVFRSRGAVMVYGRSYVGCVGEHKCDEFRLKG